MSGSGDATKVAQVGGTQVGTSAVRVVYSPVRENMCPYRKLLASAAEKVMDGQWHPDEYDAFERRIEQAKGIEGAQTELMKML